MINRMPQPARVAFVTDKRPHLVHLGFLPGTLDGHCHVVWVVGTQERGVHRLQHSFLLPEFTEHGVRTDPQHPCGIAHATGVETHVNDLMFHLGQPPKVSVVKEKTPRGTRGVLAQVPLCAAACFPAFDDLITLTMWTPDCDERHKPLLASGRCQDRAQCDINLSPSPHLEHYLRRNSLSSPPKRLTSSLACYLMPPRCASSRVTSIPRRRRSPCWCARPRAPRLVRSAPP